MKHAVLLAVFAALPALAQESVDVPVRAEILRPQDLVSISLGRDGDFGQLARPVSGTCFYQYQSQTFRVLNGQDSVDAPGVLPNGCAQFGDIVRPVINVSCRPGAPIRFLTRIESPANFTTFGVDRVVFNGEWIFRASTSDRGSIHELTCPPGEAGQTASVPVELGFYATITHQSGLSGPIDIVIPVDLLF